MDAIRVSDGRLVKIKQLLPDYYPLEVEILRVLSSRDLIADPCNHSIPVLEMLTPPGTENILLAVMPCLRPWDSPHFETYGEVIEFIRQIFEVSSHSENVGLAQLIREQGVQFLHRKRIAHR